MAKWFVSDYGDEYREAGDGGHVGGHVLMVM